MKRMLILLLPIVLFAQQKPREVPFAAWTETPLPHWSCAPGLVPREVAVTRKAKPLLDFLFESAVPRCWAQDKHMFYTQIYDYNAQIEELVTFEQEIVIRGNGNATFEWNPLFVRMPGCVITGDEREHIVQEANHEHLTIRGKPGQHLHLNCIGAIKR